VACEPALPPLPPASTAPLPPVDWPPRPLKPLSEGGLPSPGDSPHRAARTAVATSAAVAARLVSQRGDLAELTAEVHPLLRLVIISRPVSRNVAGNGLAFFEHFFHDVRSNSRECALFSTLLVQVFLRKKFRIL
jgi:hypothetical protein